MEIGPYTIERELGRGGMGAVYLGRRPSDPERYAVKVIHADLAADPDLMARFEREGAVLERLEHPNLVSFHDRGRFSAGLWLAMDYVQGESLEDRLTRGGPLPSPLAGELLTQVAAGLSHAHRAGILHRDLKPANILLRASDGQALVADFGLALPLDVSQHLTQTGEVLGSPGYLAPEQCGFGGGSTPATDVYGLGALLYAALTGLPPLRGRTLIETLDHVLTRRPRPPRELAPDVDPTLEAICLRCLAKEPSERYGDAQEVWEALSSEPDSRSKGSPLTLGVAIGVAALLGLSAGALALEPWADTSPAPARTSPAPARSSPVSPAPGPTESPTTTPSPRRTSIEAALRERRWRAGHLQAAQLSGAEAHWARYRLLAGELEERGEETPEWLAARRTALEATRGDDSPRAPVYAALIESLEDAFLGERAQLADLQRLVEALALAEDVEVRWGPAESLALLQAKALLALRVAELRRRNEDWDRAEERHAAWSLQEKRSWRVEFVRAQIQAGRGQRNSALQALRRSEAEASRLGHPWARFALYELRSRWLLTAGRVRRDQVQLSRSILAAPRVPSSLKLRASLPFAAYLVQEGQAKEAISLLERHAPAPGVPPSLRFNWAQVMAQAAAEGGEPARILPLATPEALAGQDARAADRLRFLKAIALSGLDRIAEARRLFAEIPRSDSWSAALLELWAAALLGDQERFSHAYSGSTGEPKNQVYRWQQLLRLEAIAPRALLDLEAPRAQLLETLGSRPHGIVKGLLGFGRWGEALDAIERFKGAPGEAGRQLRGRLACRALEAARQDEEPGSKRFRQAQARVQVLLREVTPRSAALGLRAIVAALGDPPDDQLPSLHRSLSDATDAHRTWFEFPRVHLRLLRNWSRRAKAPRGLEGHERAAVERWSYHDKGLEGRLALALHPGPPDLSTISRLAQEAADTKNPLQRIATRAVYTLRHEQGQLAAEHLIDFLCAETNWIGALQTERRWLLLEAADLLQPPEDHPHEVLSFLARLEAWCGLPERPAELARYRRLESEARVALGQIDRALAAARPLEALAADLGEEVRAAHQAQLGRAEHLAGEAQGLARIRKALEVAPHARGYVLLARCSSGAAQAEAYQGALGFPLPPTWTPRLREEIEAAGHSVAALQRAALPLLETRDLRSDCGIRLAQVLFAGDPTEDHARLLWETYAIGALASARRTREHPPKVLRSMLRAAKALPDPERKIADALQSLFETRIEVADGPQADPGAKMDRAIAGVLAATEGARAFSDRLRVPLHLCHAFDILGRIRPQLVWDYAKRNLQIMKAWGERGPLPLRVPILIAFHHRMLGDFRRAVEVLQETCRGPAKQLPQVEGRATLDLAVNLSDLGEEQKALQVTQRALELLEDLPDLARTYLLAAQVKLRAGSAREALALAQLASDLCPRTAAERSLFLRIQILYGRSLISAKKLPQVAPLFGSLSRNYLRDQDTDPLIVGMILTLGAELALATERYQEALQKAAKALEFQPASGDAHLVRVRTLGRLGEVAKARVAANRAIQDARLSPRDRARVRRVRDALPDAGD
jgi:serine/threonine protein kinase/tetratricopeptide (TPR) repeat protein